MNELTTTKNEVATIGQVAQSAFGLTAKDIIIPKVLLMQAISAFVKERKAFAGDFIHSIDERKLTNPLEFVVINMYREILHYEDKKYIKRENWTDQRELEVMATKGTVVKGVTLNPTVSYNYTVLLTQDIEDMTPFPVIITFKKTSKRAGMKLNTAIFSLEEFGVAPYAKTFLLTHKEDSWDGNDYLILDIQMGRKSKDQEQAVAKKWVERLAVSRVTAHEVDEDLSTGAPSGNAEAAKDVKVDSNINF